MTPESATSRIYTDFSGLAKLKASARAESPDAIAAVAKEFESTFVEMMLKSLRDASSGDGLMDNDASRMYQDMFDKQIAVDISERGDFGIAKVIEAQLTKGKPGEMPAVEGGVKGFGPSAQNPFNHTGLLNNEFIHAQNRRIHQANNAPVKEGLDQRVVPIVDLKSGRQVVNDHVLQRTSVIMNKHLPEKTTFNSPEEFIETMRPMAEQAAKEIGVDPDLLVAQAALETGWGKKVIKNKDGSISHNLFGIKANRNWDGDAVNVRSLEYRNGIAEREVSSFRSYSSFDESFRDYATFIKNHPRYDEAVDQAANRKDYIHALQDAGYATDPNYANKILNILGSKKLQHVWKGNA